MMVNPGPWLVMLVFVWTVRPLGAATLVVHPDGSGPYPSIQAAIDAATDGDIVELSDGTYRGSGNRNVLCFQKAITIRSASDDPEQCVIDCESDCSINYRGFEFNSTGEIRLQGVTIVNGCSDYGSGGVFSYAPARFVHCVFRGNRSTSTNQYVSGGAVIAAADARFEDCLFEHNEAMYGGAVMGVAGPNLSFERCVFKENTGLIYGGACCFDAGPSVSFNECLFVGNEADAGGTILALWNTTVTLDHCTATGNANGVLAIVEELGARAEVSHSLLAFNQGPAIACNGGASIACTDIFGNEGGDWVGGCAEHLGQDGNICADPQFCSEVPDEDENWTLQSDSPCAPAHSDCGLIGAREVGCGTASADEMSWGGLKSLFRK